MSSLFEKICAGLSYEGNIYDGIHKIEENAEAHGWMSDEYPKRIRQILEEAPKDQQLLIVEVGTWMGKSAIAAADIIRELGRSDVIICIDTWLGSPEHFHALPRSNGFPYVLYKAFLQNVVNHDHQSRIIPIPLPSSQAAVVLKEINIKKADIIYIDAAHEFLPVINDINDYWHILKPGGIMLGDDYRKEWQGVIDAVNYFSADHGNIEIKVNDVVWELQKPIE